MDLSNVILDYQKTITGLWGDVVLQERHYYTYARQVHGKWYWNFIYLNNFTGNNSARVNLISASSSTNTYRGRTAIADMQWFSIMGTDSMSDEGYGENFPTITRNPGESRTDWYLRVREVYEIPLTARELTQLENSGER